MYHWLNFQIFTVVTIISSYLQKKKTIISSERTSCTMSFLRKTREASDDTCWKKRIQHLYYSPQDVKTKPRCPLVILITFLISTVETLHVTSILSRSIISPRQYNALIVSSLFSAFRFHTLSPPFHFSPPFCYIYTQHIVTYLCMYRPDPCRSETDLRFGYGLSVFGAGGSCFTVRFLAGEIIRRW